MADARAGREEDLLVGLVVAVHVDAAGVEAGAQRHVQLAAGGDVDREPLLGEQPVGGGAGQRLAGEEDLEVGAPALERVAVGAGAGAHVVLGIDVCRRAELCGQLDHVAAADLEMPALVDPAPGRVDHRPRDRVHQCACLSALRHRTGIVTVEALPPVSGGGQVPTVQFRRAGRRPIRRLRRRLRRPSIRGRRRRCRVSSVALVCRGRRASRWAPWSRRAFPVVLDLPWPAPCVSSGALGLPGVRGMPGTMPFVPSVAGVLAGARGAFSTCERCC